MDKLERFKKLCALKMALESVSRRCEDGRTEFNKWHIKNMVDGHCLHILQGLLKDAKIELNIPIEAIDELKGR